MNQSSPIHRTLLRCIVIFYLLLFLTGLASSGYFLAGIIQVKPIIAISLFKYILLCILFLLLSQNALKALTLLPQRLYRLSENTRNFKWLFTIAILISIAARCGLFNLTAGKSVTVTDLQIGILTALAAFCFWSDTLLTQEENIEKEDDIL